MERRDQPTGIWVDPVKVGRVDDGSPDGAVCEREPDRMRLTYGRCESLRARVDPSDFVTVTS